MKKTLFCFMAAAALSVSAGDVNRKRDVIFYHYDIMPVLWPKALPYTPDALVNGFQHPSRLMDGLPSKALAAEVKPDTFVYVPMPNFANLSAMVPSNEPQMNQPSGSTWMAGCKNAMPEIKKAGKSQDPITVVGNWVRKNKKEFFVGLCVNDNLFQSGYSQLKPSPPGPILVENYLFNSFKIKHPDWLMSSHQDSAPLKGLTRSGNAPYASWCLVDYNQPEVRAKFTAIAKEIIAGYELDGLLLDFCRQPRLFRSVAWGGTASAAQCQMITEMIGLISAAAKEKGCLLAVRVPDSLMVCKDAGMDVPAWFAQKFVDLLFVGGTVELNHWSAAAEMAQKCGVPFYASIDQARIYATNDEGNREDDQRMRRQCPEVYRARVTEARIAGAKGIMYSSGREEWWDSWWNYTSPSLFQPEQEKIRLQNKRYFVNYRTRTGQFVKDMLKYSPVLSQSLITFQPKEIKGTARYEIYVWDDFPTLKKERVVPKCYLTTIIEIPSGWTVDVNINGKPLKVIKKRAGSQIYEIPAGVTLYGKNEIVLSVKGNNRRGLVPRIGNLGIDVIFNGELEALKKPGNVLVPQKPAAAGAAGKGTASAPDAAKGKAVTSKKGGSK